MSESKNIPFRLVEIDDRQFAVLQDAYKEDCGVNLKVEVPIKVSDEENMIGVFLNIQFCCEDRPFIVCEIVCNFEITAEAYESMFVSKGKKKKLVLPVGLCRHLATITVGTARGVLYEKLKKTDFSEFILPTIDLTKIIDKDIEMNRG